MKIPPKRSSAPTLNDVARLAGTNRASVSVVLNGARSGGGVSEATRHRILTAADKLQYRPNVVARSLRRRSTNILGFYFGQIAVNARNSFVAEILGGLQSGCDAFEKDLLLYGPFSGRSRDEIYMTLAGGKIDGLVLALMPDDRLIERLAASHLPVIAVGEALPKLPSVVVDDAAGSRLLAEHLARKGHRRILYERGENRLVSLDRRFHAFCEAASEQGISVEAFVANRVCRLGETQRGRLTAPRGERPTAAVCWSDSGAHDLIAYCKGMGLQIPADMAVAGFNGIAHEGEYAYELTTIRAPWARVAEGAVSLLVDRIEGKEVPLETVLPVELVMGNTV